MSNSIRVGDAVFLRTGLPATVKERNPVNGELRLEADPEAIREQTRHGYINGMPPEVRDQLNAILDDVKGNTHDQAQRVDEMRSRLAELDKDPHNLALSKYLRAEMVHLINTFDIKPKEYTVNETEVR